MIGAGAMLVLVVLTLVGSGIDNMTGMGEINDGTYLSNFLIGGAIGGALTGLYAAENRKQRVALRRQADRLEVLNRSLRDRVLNAVLAIDGQIGVLADRDDPELRQQVVGTVRDQADTIQRTVDDVKYLARSSADAQKGLDATALGTAIEEAIAAVDADHPSITVEITDRPRDDVSVWGNVMLERAIEHVLVRAVEGDAEHVEIAINTTDRDAHVRVTDDGAGLTAAQREILEEGASGDYDDPSVGFGLNVVRLVTDTLDGQIACAEADGSTTVELAIPIADAEVHPGQSTATDVRAYGVPATTLGLTVIASLLAGVTMGVVGQATSGVVPIIGALYGNMNAVVGWITHEFHSVVFGLVYAGVLASVPDPYAEDWRWCLAVAVGWAVVLWALAAGVIMPLWLRLVGVPSMIPTLDLSGLLGHLVWGLTLGSLTIGGQILLDRDATGDDD